MATISADPKHSLIDKTHQHKVVAEEIEGLIRVFGDGHVERPPIVPNVNCAVASELGVIAKDIVLNKSTNLWARLYVPSCHGKLPLLIYFHGGGFCVGSAYWSCYHNFIASFTARVGCVVMSVNYRLAPENRLPAAYEDGCNAVMWVKQQAQNGSGEHKWWLSKCNVSSMFLAGDSAGANIAYHVASQLSPKSPSDFPILTSLRLKGAILIQPFFGGETRAESEKHTIQSPGSPLTLSASDIYWHLSLPVGANKDHPWCNPLIGRLGDLRLPPMMVCIAETDILKDRNLAFCAAMAKAGKKVEKVIYKGVGHAFQVLHDSQLSQLRKQELMSHLKAFISQNE